MTYVSVTPRGKERHTNKTTIKIAQNDDLALVDNNNNRKKVWPQKMQ